MQVKIILANVEHLEEYLYSLTSDERGLNTSHISTGLLQRDCDVEV